jgi:hypothetical protein
VTPYYEDDVVTIYHGDCRDIDAWLVADVLVMDPPYGISWNQPAYLARGRSSGQRTAQHAGIQNDGDTTARDCVLDAWGQRPAMVFGSPLHPPMPGCLARSASGGEIGSPSTWLAPGPPCQRLAHRS